MDDVESGLVELRFNIFSWSQVACIMQMKSMNDTSPQSGARTENMRLHFKLPIRKLISVKHGRRSGIKNVWHLDYGMNGIIILGRWNFRAKAQWS